MAGENRSFWVYFKGDLGDLQNKTRAAKREMRQAKRDIDTSMRAIGRGMTVVGGAIVGTLGYAVKEAAQFQTGVREIATLGVQDMETLEQGIRDVARSYGKDLTLSAKGAYDIVSATGADGAEAIMLLDAAAKASVAGLTDIQTAASLGLDVLNAFGMESQDIGKIYDEAFTAVRLGKTTFEELAKSVGNLAPTFAAAGLSSDEMMASISALTLAGVSTAEASTGLRAAITNIIKPSEQAKTAASALGLEFDAAALRSQGLEGFLENVGVAIRERGPELAQIREGLGEQIAAMEAAAGGTAAYQHEIKELRDQYKDLEGVSDDQLTMMAALFGSVRGLSSMLALTGNQADRLSDALREIGDATGALDTAYKAFTTDNAAHNMAVLGAQLKDVGITIGNALLPALASFAEWIGGVASSVAAWTKENRGLTETLVKIAAVMGGLMVTLGPLLIMLPGLVAGFTALKATLALLTASSFVPWIAAAIGVPGVGLIGLAVALAAIAGAAGIGWAFGRWIDSITENTAFGRWIDSMSDKLVGLIGKLKEWLGLSEGVDPYGDETPEQRNRRVRAEAGLPPHASGGARSGSEADGFFAMASRVASQGSGLVRQVAEATPPMVTAVAAGGGALNLNISFGDVRIREQADINRIADAITRRAYDMLAQRGIRR